MDILALDDDTYKKIYELLEFVDNYDKTIEKISFGFIKPKEEEREEFILKYINEMGLTDKIIIVLKNELIEK